MEQNKRHVYLIQSISNPRRRYVGVTSDVTRRLQDHNQGRSPHTSQYRPWRLVADIKFDGEKKARRFERYLKSGSGRAFASRYFWNET